MCESEGLDTQGGGRNCNVGVTTGVPRAKQSRCISTPRGASRADFCEKPAYGSKRFAREGSIGKGN